MYLILYQSVQQYIISTKLKYLHKKYFHSLLFNTKIKKEKKYIKKNKNIYTKKYQNSSAQLLLNPYVSSSS